MPKRKQVKEVGELLHDCLQAFVDKADELRVCRARRLQEFEDLENFGTEVLPKTEITFVAVDRFDQLYKEDRDMPDWFEMATDEEKSATFQDGGRRRDEVLHALGDDADFVARTGEDYYALVKIFTFKGAVIPFAHDFHNFKTKVQKVQRYSLLRRSGVRDNSHADLSQGRLRLGIKTS
jgi:hypothetical protein